MLRHTLATLAYRAGKVVRDAPPDFSGFTPAPGSRSAGQILAHMGDLMDWALSIVEARQTWQDSPPQAWDADVQRFCTGLRRFDAAILAHPPDQALAGKLFQGPVADALTHVGQIAMMRRLAAAPIRAENYFAAAIAEGQIGSVQPAPRMEF